MKKLFSSLILLSLLTGCATNGAFSPKRLLPGEHMYPVVYVRCLGSVFTHSGILLADDKVHGIVLDIGNGKLKKLSYSLCGVVKTGKDHLDHKL